MANDGGKFKRFEREFIFDKYDNQDSVTRKIVESDERIFDQPKYSFPDRPSLRSIDNKVKFMDYKNDSNVQLFD